MRIDEFRLGQQIIYIPRHVQDATHPACERGFVTSIAPYGIFCRYWRPDSLQEGKTPELRTGANSERTQTHLLHTKRSVCRDVITDWFKQEYGPEVDLGPRLELTSSLHCAWLTRIETGMTTQDDADIARDLLDELANLSQIMASALNIAENELDKAR